MEIASTMMPDEGELLPDDGEQKLKPRRWESRLVKQKTISGEITVRKWVSDELPSFAAKHANGEVQTVRN